MSRVPNARLTRYPAVCTLALAIAGPASAGFTLYWDKPSWEAAVPGATTLSFSEFTDGAFLTDQYASLGVTFLNGDDQVTFGPITYPEDGWGIDANADCHLLFDSDQFALAVLHPGLMKLKLYNDGTLVYSSFALGGSGYGFFNGVVSSVPFDEAVILAAVGSQINIDDIYFGVPAPGVLPALLAAPMLMRSRRRRLPRAAVVES